MAYPRIGVERVALEELRRGAREISRPPFGHQAHDARGRTSVLRGIVRGEQLHFLDRVHMLRAEHRVLGGTGTVGDR